MIFIHIASSLACACYCTCSLCDFFAMLVSINFHVLDATFATAFYKRTHKDALQDVSGCVLNELGFKPPPCKRRYTTLCFTSYILAR